MNNQKTCFVPAALLLFGVLALAPLSAWAYGDSGGGGGASGGGGGGSGPMGDLMGGGGGSPMPDPWTPSELDQIFGGLSPSQRSDLVSSFTGTTVDKRSLLEVRQVFNVQNMNTAQNQASIIDAMVKTLEVLDQTGQLAQDGLSFVPGVGWVTSATLGAARSGANAYRDGKSGREIAIKALSGGTAAAIMGKFSGADKALRNVRRASGLATGALSKSVRQKAQGFVGRAVSKFMAKKARDKVAEDTLGAVTEKTLNAAVRTRTMPNRTAVPSYSPRGGFTQGMLK